MTCNKRAMCQYRALSCRVLSKSVRAQEYDFEEPSGPPSQEGALAALHGIPRVGAGLFHPAGPQIQG